MTALRIVDTVREMIASGRRSEAGDLCRHHLSILSAGAESSILQGLLFTAEDRPDDAITAFDTALSFAPDALVAYQGIARILAAKGWLHSALVVMENAQQATSLTPEAEREMDALRTQLAAASHRPSMSDS